MKKLVLTMASLVMLASMAFAQNETPMLPESHGMTDNQPAWGSSQDFNLAGDWSWWSTYINTDLTALEEALGENGLQIKSFGNGFVQNSTAGWNGMLNAINNNEMFVIGMVEGTATATNNYSFRLRGSRANADQVLISVSANNWNWVGYPVAVSMSVADALVNYTPATDDIFKSNTDGFVQYLNGEWYGNLDALVPGQGYMLYSMQDNDVTYTYPSAPAKGRTLVSSIDKKDTQWQPVMASNPTNMNMIAMVTINNEELRSENVEIGVFNGEICRGAVRPIYVEDFDQYLVFLTMYGEENEPFSFRMLDEDGNVYESNEASVSYKANGVVGGVRAPFALNFNSKNSFAGALNLFPNPVNRGEMVNLTLPADGTVEVVNMLGSTVKRVRMAEGTQLAADMAPGIYTIKVTDAEGNVFVDKLIVK